MKLLRHCLTVAGSDPSGGAGIGADIKTFSALDCYAMSIITSVVAENTFAVKDKLDVPAEIITAQLEAVFEDIRVDGMKIGMLTDISSVKAVAAAIEKYKPPIIVFDPVMNATAGAELLSPQAVETVKKRLIPLCTLVTPNIPEAEVLTVMSIESTEDMKAAAKKIADSGAKAVLLKGGHLSGNAEDLLFDGKDFRYYSAPRISTNTTHGTGCTLSSAITAFMVNGCLLPKAVEKAKEFITGAIENGLDIGKGNGPLNQFYKL
ncbi:MAG: bifunctional hydroxymethylpyrimidine kinase/phosphomethylpyrimidine kinase [Ruminiclostridium sp.]